METQYETFIREMEDLFRGFIGAQSILTAVLDGAGAETTTLEHVTNAGDALNDYLSGLLDRMDRAILNVSVKTRKSSEVFA